VGAPNHTYEKKRKGGSYNHGKVGGWRFESKERGKKKGGGGCREGGAIPINFPSNKRGAVWKKERKEKRGGVRSIPFRYEERGKSTTLALFGGLGGEGVGGRGPKRKKRELERVGGGSK